MGVWHDEPAESVPKPVMQRRQWSMWLLDIACRHDTIDCGRWILDGDHATNWYQLLLGEHATWMASHQSPWE